MKYFFKLSGRKFLSFDSSFFSSEKLLSTAQLVAQHCCNWENMAGVMFSRVQLIMSRKSFPSKRFDMYSEIEQGSSWNWSACRSRYACINNFAKWLQIILWRIAYAVVNANNAWQTMRYSSINLVPDNFGFVFWELCVHKL